MVVISETSDDDGSCGDVHLHQNKKRKEEENRNKKRKEKVKVSYTTLPLPDDLILRCFLLVQRCHHSSLSLVCSSFLHLMPKLYNDRLRLGYTESVLYAYIGFPPLENPSWHILNPKPCRNLSNTVSLRLCRVDILPPMPWGSAIVTIGSDIYVIGGRVGGKKRILDMTLIDCKFHKHRSLPRMKVARCRAAAGVMDGKIYVIGGCKVRPSDWVEVFDIEKQSWSSVPGPYPNVYMSGEFLTYAVMKEKIYCLDIYSTALVYDPKRGKWDSEPGLLNVLWNESYCVIDHLLFSINPILHFNGDDPINIYDSEHKTWFPLKGLQGFPDNILRDECKMASFGDKLVVLGADGKKREIWCVEIAWQRKEDGTFWGKVESVAVVLTPPKTSSVYLCRTVSV
ncbi:hypothetical protein CARUB_v10025685mg [Capsella rubella]|uniref:FKB95-like N-terminal Kelch domain-containing protein n=1 Tax=Capsella rubella TaxID=81985 RepID=R0G1W6_9BRAS|nr:putative F-box/kelch-repeat protein At2g21680 [Capsella rubella]EOA29397.1 hypothetical protein CARUB_v10025685mg [Capsella rubella]